MICTHNTLVVWLNYNRRFSYHTGEDLSSSDMISSTFYSKHLYCSYEQISLLKMWKPRFTAPSCIWLTSSTEHQWSVGGNHESASLWFIKLLTDSTLSVLISSIIGAAFRRAVIHLIVHLKIICYIIIYYIMLLFFCSCIFVIYPPSLSSPFSENA